jgi:hypothetical protein
MENTTRPQYYSSCTLPFNFDSSIEETENYSSSVASLSGQVYISLGRWQHFPLWLLFLQRDRGKRTKMTGTQHVGTLKRQFLHYITIKTVLDIFHYQNDVLVFSTSVIW